MSAKKRFGTLLWRLSLAVSPNNVVGCRGCRQGRHDRCKSVPINRLPEACACFQEAWFQVPGNVHRQAGVRFVAKR